MMLGSHWIKATRKPHHCMWCNERIEVGSAAEHSAGVVEGDFSAYHMHPECACARDHLTRKQRDDMEGTWEAGEFSRGRCDDKKEPPTYGADYRGRMLV